MKNIRFIALCLAIVTIGQINCSHHKVTGSQYKNDNDESSWMTKSTDRFEYRVSEKYRSVLADQNIEFNEKTESWRHDLDTGITRTKTTVKTTNHGFIVERVEIWTTKNPETTWLGTIVYGILKGIC